MRLALAQLNPTIGDLQGNTALVLEAVRAARAQAADLVVGPELAIIGYPPRDLLLREGVVGECEQAVRVVAANAGDVTVAVGHPRRASAGVRGLRNSVSICRDGEIRDVYDKRLLPGYDIFDEDRYFDPGDRPCVIELPTGRVGLVTCEDLWQAGDVAADPHYRVDPVAELVAQGCAVIVSPNASPFVLGKFERHLELARAAARRHGVPIVAINQVGANDDLIFEGRSFAVDTRGAVIRVLPAWRAAVETIELTPDAATRPAGVRAAEPAVDRMEDLCHALVLGVRDYAGKTGHRGAIVGLSGGIDSAVTAVVGVLALGGDAVAGLMMPSRYSSPGSRTDARLLAERLRLGALEEVGIEAAHDALDATLTPALPGPMAGVTDENVQARLRGLILMARSNATGALVLATSNKSELAVGYSTLYGDMCGALAVLGDVLKGRVYELAAWINTHHATLGLDTPPIPEGTLTKPPSAELRPDQTDQDTLPPYADLDAIVERLVEREQSVDRVIAETGLDAALVRSAATLIDRAEHKRYQAALVLKVTERTFGRGRPMPIVMRSSPAPSQDVPGDARTRALARSTRE